MKKSCQLKTYSWIKQGFMFLFPPFLQHDFWSLPTTNAPSICPSEINGEKVTLSHSTHRHTYTSPRTPSRYKSMQQNTHKDRECLYMMLHFLGLKRWKAKNKNKGLEDEKEIPPTPPRSPAAKEHSSLLTSQIHEWM